jgi:hypothetical protein
MIFAARIAKGDNLADLPIVQSTEIELSVNLKAAKMLSLGASLSARPRRRGDRISKLMSFVGTSATSHYVAWNSACGG